MSDQGVSHKNAILRFAWWRDLMGKTLNMTFFSFTKEKSVFYRNGGCIVRWARWDWSQIAKVENAMADYATERKCDIAIMRWAETAMGRIANICDAIRSHRKYLWWIKLFKQQNMRFAICDGSHRRNLRWAFFLDKTAIPRFAICDEWKLQWIAAQIFAMHQFKK